MAVTQTERAMIDRAKQQAKKVSAEASEYVYYTHLLHQVAVQVYPGYLERQIPEFAAEDAIRAATVLINKLKESDEKARSSSGGERVAGTKGAGEKA